MNLCPVVFTPAAMAECEQRGHRWVRIRTWGPVVWPECARCGESGAVEWVIAENEMMAIVVPAEPAPRETTADEDAAYWRSIAGPRGNDENVESDNTAAPSIPLCARPRWSRDHAERDAEVLRLHEAGKSSKEIAHAVGLHRSRIRQIVRQAEKQLESVQ